MRHVDQRPSRVYFGLSVGTRAPGDAVVVAVAYTGTPGGKDVPVGWQSMGLLGLELTERAHLARLSILLLMRTTSCGGDAPPRRGGQTVTVRNLQKRRVRVRRIVSKKSIYSSSSQK